MGRTVIDPLTGPRYAIQGRVVTMDAADNVLDPGVIYVDQGSVVAVMPVGQEPPGFTDSPVIDTGGSIYPGLIDLHNHLSYDALPLWAVPRMYTNRNQWQGI